MKQLLFACFLWLVALPSMAQGTLNFVTRVTGSLDAPAFDTDGATRLAGSGFRAQLYAGKTEATLAPVGAAVNFRTGAGAGYVDTGAGSTREVAGVPAGTQVYAQVRAWDAAKGGSYEQALAAGGKTGRSLVIRVTAGGGLQPPANLLGLVGFKLELNSPPGIQTHPSPVTIGVGGIARFQVVASGPAPYQYQWRKGTADLPGATSATLEIRSVSTSDAGTYSVRVSNPHGSTESRGALLTVAPVPTITRISVTPTVPQVGKSLRLEAFVDGSGPFTYRWLLNGGAIGGAVASVYETERASAGAYSVEVTGPGGTSRRDAVTVSSQFALELVVDQGGSIGATPLQAAYDAGTVVSLRAQAEDGFEFVGWSGDATGTANPASITMNGPKRVEALFRTVGGTIYFANRSLAVGLDAPVFDLNGTTPLSGAAYLAQLYAGPTEAALEPVGSPVEFRDGDGAGYFYSEVRAVPGVVPGQTARVQVRVWKTADGPTFEAAKAAKGATGVSALLSIVTGNAGSPPTHPAFLTGHSSFALGTDVAPTSYTLALTPSEGGTATATPSQATYPPGTEVTLSATAADGYVFAGWSGDLTGGANPATVTMDANKAITPLFGVLGGTVYFANRALASGLDAPIFDTDGHTPLSGDAFLAQLYAGASEDTLAAVGVPTPFRTGEGAGYFLPGNRAIRAVAAGQPAYVEVRAWAVASGSTFETALAANGKTGTSGVLKITTGNAGTPPTLPAPLTGLASFSLQQNSAPRITTEPKAIAVVAGNPATFEVTATGTAPLTYAWSKDGNPITGATSRVLTMARVTAQDVGAYAVRVSNARGFADSASARLTLLHAPVITKVNVVPNPPVAGRPLRIEVAAEGTEPLTYVWTRDNSVIPGATASVLQRNAAELGLYAVRVSGPGGSIAREVATVSSQFVLERNVDQGGRIEASPAAASYARGTVVQLTAVPDSGYVFAGWGGDLGGTANPSTITMDAHQVVTASFRPTGGTLYFANRSLAVGIDAPIFDLDGTTRLAGDRFRAQLFAGPTADTLVPVGDPIAFRTGDGAGYFPSATRSVPGVSPGAVAFVQVRAWQVSGDEDDGDEDNDRDDGDAGEGASRKSGASAVLEIKTGNQGNPPTLPAPLVGLTSFKLEIPRAPEVMILSAPGNLTVGDKAHLLAVATGSKPITYHWFQGAAGDTSKPVGVNAPSFESGPLLESLSFWVRASNSFGTGDSPAVTVTVARKTQTIVFAPVPPVALGGSPAPLSARAGSGLPVSFSLVTGPATLEGNVLTPTAAGTARVRATQPGDATYQAASPVEQDIEILRGRALVLLDHLQQVADGTPRKPSVTTTPAGLPVALAFEGRSSPPSEPGTYTVVATVDSPDYTGRATARFQLTPGVNLVGMVFKDVNADGRRQEDEPGLAGATLELLDLETDAVLRSFTTQLDGAFAFPGLAAGGYRLREINPAGHVSTTPDLRLVGVRLEAVTEVHFGDHPAGTVSGLVYEDVDGDGSQDEGESGLSGVTLTLHGAGTSRTTVTDSTGVFEFPNVQAGSYRVEETDPAGFASTTPNTRPLSVGAGGSATASFGDQSVGTISGTVFADLNASGDQEEGEPGLGGVTLLLTGREGTLTRTTSDTGAFRFDDLTPGPYTLEEIDPAGYTSTTPNRRTLHVGSRGAASASFGDQQLATVSGIVFDDLNGNGLLEDGEPGLGNVALRLTGDGNRRNATTLADGRFTFPNIEPGTFHLEELDPPGYTSTTPNVRVITVASGGAASATFGDQAAGNVAGIVFADQNGNGLRDDAESGLGGVAIRLLGAGGTRNTVTSGDGTYLFTGLPPGSYTVEETDPEGFVSTTPNERAVSLARGGAASASFGDQAVKTISGVVFEDQNGNGAFDTGEPGIGGVALSLLKASDESVVHETTTASSGLFVFADVPAGDYLVRQTVPDAYTVLTTGAAASRHARHAEAGDSEFQNKPVTLAEGGAAAVSFGNNVSGQITGLLFNDLDGDGQPDPTEPGLGGVTVDVRHSQTGDLVVSTTTSGSGLFLAGNLPAGIYQVVPAAVAGYAARQSSLTVTLTAQGAAVANFAQQAIGTLSGHVVNDEDASGTADGFESGLGGVIVTLTRPDGSHAETATSGDGSFLFTGLTAGAYSVAFTPPQGFTATTPVSANVTLSAGGAGSTTFGARATPAPTDNAYAQWAATQNLPQQARRPSDDADGDGLANLFEYFIGSNPASAGSGQAPEGLVVSRDGQSFVGFRVTRSASAAGVRPVLQASDDLVTWTVVASVVEDAGGQVVQVREAAPTSAHGHRFLRFGVEETAKAAAPARVTVVSGPPLSSSFRLAVEGDAGATYRLEWSTDLVTWTLLRQVTTTGTSATQITDDVPAGSPHRFYRTTAP